MTTGNNPKSLAFQAAVCREASAIIKDPVKAEALWLAAANLGKVASAVPAMQTVLAIYEVWPDAEMQIKARDIGL